MKQAPGFAVAVRSLSPGWLGSREKFVVGEITAVQDIAKLVGGTDLETLKAYLTFIT